MITHPHEPPTIQPRTRISLSAGGSCFNMVSFTRFQYGLSATVRPWFPRQTTSHETNLSGR